MLNNRHLLIAKFIAPVALLSASILPAAPTQEPPPSDPPVQPQDEREAADIPEIVVIGSLEAGGLPEVPMDSVGSRDIISPETVRETGAREVNDLVNYLPAISARPYNGGEASAPSFSSRGLPDDGLTEYLNVMIDGVPASPLPYGWTAFSFLPITPDRIFAVDSIRGAHSVRYSPNTVGGILNFLTPPIPGRSTVESRTTFGTFDYSSTMLSAGGSGADMGWRLDYVDRRGDGYREDGGFDQQEIAMKMNFDRGDGSWLATSFGYMEDEHQAPGGLTQTEFDADPFSNSRPENRFDGMRGVANVVLHEKFSDSTWLEGFSTLSWTSRHLRAQRPHFGTPTSISNWTDDSYFGNIGVRSEHKVMTGGLEHTIYSGARYQREWIPAWQMETEPYPGGAGTPTLNSEFLLESFSMHVDDTIRPTERLKINFGARLEWVPTAEGSDDVGAGFDFDSDFLAVLPGAGISYSITDSVTVFANAFEGFRAPQFWGYGLTPDPSTADLDFEMAQSYELGGRLRGPGGVGASATLWRNDYDDLGVFDSGFYENLGEIQAEGIDLQADWDVGAVSDALEGLSFMASVTLQDSELQSGPNAGNAVPYAWESKAAWRSRYAFRSGWVVSLGGTYVGDSFSDDANTEVENPEGTLGINPSRTLWDAQVSHETVLSDSATLRLAVGATNLFDHDWYVHSRGGFFGGGLVAGAPRQAYFGFQLSVGF